MIDKKEAKERIKSLISLFDSNKQIFMSKAGEEGEREIEEDLITPFFKALGWFTNDPSVPITELDPIFWTQF